MVSSFTANVSLFVLSSGGHPVEFTLLRSVFSSLLLLLLL